MRNLVLTVLCLFVLSPVDARTHRHHAVQAAPITNNCFRTDDVMRPCVATAFPNPFAGAQKIEVKMKRVSSRLERRSRRLIAYAPSYRQEEETRYRPSLRNDAAMHMEIQRTVEERPRDCYGIQWCGCFLRHYYGLADRNLNLADNWRSVGSPTNLHVGAIAVWHHHVGIVQSEPDEHGRVLLLSGNNGSGNRATVRPARIAGAVFRQL